MRAPQPHRRADEFEAGLVEQWSPRGLAALLRAALRRAFVQAGELRGPLLRIALVVGAGLLALFALSRATGTPMALLTRDLAAITGAKFYHGVLSNVGALAWCAAATICLLAAALLRERSDEGELRGFLAASGAMLAALGLDDFFMLHEVVYPKLGLPEEAVIALYALAQAALMLRWRLVLLHSELLLYLIGCMLFALSVIVDAMVRDATALEDTTKVAAVFVWSCYFWRLALSRLRAATG